MSREVTEEASAEGWEEEEAAMVDEVLRREVRLEGGEEGEEFMV